MELAFLKEMIMQCQSFKDLLGSEDDFQLLPHKILAQYLKILRQCSNVCLNACLNQNHLACGGHLK